jgi:hypothetical protein
MNGYNMAELLYSLWGYLNVVGNFGSKVIQLILHQCWHEYLNITTDGLLYEWLRGTHWLAFSLLARSWLLIIMKLPSHFLAVILSLFKMPIAAQNTIDLGTAQWTLSNPTYNISISGSVPSQAHLDLYEHGVIPDPYFGTNDVGLRWIAETNWTYSAPLDTLCVFW